jgi:hypothetical protein
VAIEINDIVQIAGTRPLAERSNLLSKCLFIRIAVGPQPVVRTIRVGVKNLASHGWQHELLIRSEIELDLWPATRP